MSKSEYILTNEKIETNIISILYANIDIKFTDYTLLNKLITDKYNNLNRDGPTFQELKLKFLWVLHRLMENYDDIIVSKTNNTFIICCLSTPVDIKKINLEKIKSWEQTKYEFFPNPVKLSPIDLEKMFDYIYSSNPDEFLYWNDSVNNTYTKNSIFHTLVLNSNLKLIETLLEKNNFNFKIKNSEGKTPLEIPTTIEVYSTLSLYLLEKVNKLSEINDINKSKIKYLQSEEHNKNIITNTNFLKIIHIKIDFYDFVKFISLINMITWIYIIVKNYIK